MQDIVGIILIAFGLVLILIGVLVWLGIIKPNQPARNARGNSTIIDLLMALLEKAPWVVIVGLVLVVLGIAVLGVELPF